MTRLILILAMLAFATPALATELECEVDGQIVPCPEERCVVWLMLEEKPRPWLGFDKDSIVDVCRRGRGKRERSIVQMAPGKCSKRTGIVVWSTYAETRAIIARACDE